MNRLATIVFTTPLASVIVSALIAYASHARYGS